MKKIRFEVQHSVDGKTWFRYLEKFPEQTPADDFAKEKACCEFGTRVLRVESEVLREFPKNRKPAPDFIVPGIGRIDFIPSKACKKDNE